MEKKELGIELFKDLSKDVIGLAKKAAEAYVDKHISPSEWGGIVIKAIPVLTDLTKAGQIIDEIKDFDTQEGIDYINFLMSLGMLKEEAQVIAMDILDYIKYQIDGFPKAQKILDHFKKTD